MTVVGSKRTVVVDALARDHPLTIFERGASHHEEPGEENASTGRMTIPSLRRADALQEACRRFVESVRNGSDPLGTARSGAIAVSVVEALERSVDREEIVTDPAADPLDGPSEVVPLPLAPR
jgi:hypothetical protein